MASCPDLKADAEDVQDGESEEGMSKTYESDVCRGSYALGTACGHCERCADERARVAMIMPGINAQATTAVTPTALSEHRRSEVAFAAEQEPMAIYRFDDGSVLKAKSVLLHAERIEGAYNPDGTPMYALTWNQVMVIVAPDEIKRKP